MNVEKHTAAEAPPDAPEGTAQTEKTALILAPGSVHKLCDPANLYTRRGREKTQEEFAAADKGADGQKVPFWDGRQTGGTR